MPEIPRPRLASIAFNEASAGPWSFSDILSSDQLAPIVAVVTVTLMAAIDVYSYRSFLQDNLLLDCECTRKFIHLYLYGHS